MFALLANLSSDIRYSDRDFNTGTPHYEAGCSLDRDVVFTYSEPGRQSDFLVLDS
jgi:hypothetical protein